MGVMINSVRNTVLAIANKNNYVKDKLLWILLISTVSQIGDFTISLFKRKSKLKNTGSIIPGHGGLLDRIDGMIFALPFTYIYLNFVTH